MSAIYVVIIAAASALALYLAVRASFPRAAASVVVPEAILLEEAVVVEPVAPGMEGKAEIRKGGSKPLRLRVLANDASQAYARGTKVRVIDLREGLCIIEGADEVHLVR